MPTPDEPLGLYRPEFEHDACGTGFITTLNGRKNHQIVDDALTMLANMEHRGACGADAESGDGAGLLLQVPHWFLLEECTALSIRLPEPGGYGVGMAFLPKDEALRAACRAVIDGAATQRGCPVLGYRPVPVNPAGIGHTARAAEPVMEQVFFGRPAGISSHLIIPRNTIWS